MSPEAKLAAFAKRIHLQEDDVDYLLALLQEARGLGSRAGAESMREACAKRAEELEAIFEKSEPNPSGPGRIISYHEFADALRTLKI